MVVDFTEDERKALIMALTNTLDSYRNDEEKLNAIGLPITVRKAAVVRLSELREEVDNLLGKLLEK